MSKARTLANLISDNAELADGQISVAEVVGAAPTANPTFTGTASGTFSGPLTGNVTGNLTGAVTGDITGDLDLTAIAKDISDTAVNVFVYDTSKDSDGGAWRKRTQHTSWYNETLNTSTRGSRKEFPAVAVIVAEIRTVTIYDGDDPALPMWMDFPNSGGGKNLINTGDSRNWTSVFMLNGLLCVGMGYGTTAGMGLDTADFITDSGYRYRNGTGGTNYRGQFGGNIAQRRTGRYNGLEPRGVIVDETVNDVAMTVLPNAPIDSSTGLPVPTIAVATNDGVSVIKDDGSVVDITDATDAFGTVEFTQTNRLIIGYKIYTGMMVSGGIPVADTTRSNWSSYYYQNTSVPALTGGAAKKVAEYNFGDSYGLTLLEENETSMAQGSVAYVASDYNTGHMVGDIKLATLSDTDDTDVTGAELVTNGDFSSATGWTAQSGWSISGGAASCSGSSGVYLFQDSGIPANTRVTLSFEITSYTSGSVRPGSTGFASASTFSSVGSHSITYTTAANDPAGIELYSINFVGTIDNVSVRLAEEDRSVNGNGLQVFGTVTKSEKVATNADLVAYGGFSTAVNYLEQPHNPDITFSAGADYSVIWWMKTSTTNYSNVWMKGKAGNSQLQADDFLIQMQTNGVLRSYPRGSGSWDAQLDSASVNDGVWHCVALVRRGSTLQWYVDGVAGNIGTHSRAFGSSTSVLRIGRRTDSTSSAYNGRLALFRISATAPSPEKIKKIYEDEKHLFQENAQATLYGSSDAVTALAYDDSTELLHVGTSAGRSVFQGLRRVDNTTDAVGAAISASNGLVAED